MAKRKPKPRTVDDLTTRDILQLRQTLLGTRWHVHTLVRTMFRIESTGERIFERLRDVAKIRRCVECSEWCPLEEFSVGLPDFCEECAATQEADERDEPESDFHDCD